MDVQRRWAMRRGRWKAVVVDEGKEGRHVKMAEMTVGTVNLRGWT